MNTKQFKKLLKESIVNPESLFEEVENDTSPEAMRQAAKKQQQRAAEKEKPDGSGRAVTRWQKSSPETFERYRNAIERIAKSYNILANARNSMNDKQWLKAFITLFNLESLGYDRKFDEQFLNFIDKSFGNKQDPLSFANFRKSMANWNKMRVRDEGDFWKIEDSGGNILLRESLNIFLKENLGDDTKNILTYHGKIFLDAFNDHRQQAAKEKGHESAEDEEEFSEKKISRLADMLDAARQEIDSAAGDLTSENLLTLLRYYMFQNTLEDPETMEELHKGFASFVDRTIGSFFEAGEGRNIKQLFNGLLKLLVNSPLYKSPSVQVVNKLLKQEKQKTLLNLNTLIGVVPRGWNDKDNIDSIGRYIADYKTGASQLNESLQHGEVKEYLESFLPFAKKRLGYDREPKITFASDPENGQLTLGKTAYYEPQSMAVTVFTDNRHPKDIMRSLSHELVHHAQNCDGQFDRNLGVGEGYAQNDEHLRKMEEDAYLRGNMCFRDWEDGFKQNNPLMEKRERLYYELLRRFK
jgi:hypothetical protein